MDSTSPNVSSLSRVIGRSSISNSPKYANVCGRNWFAERNPVALSESVYEESFARLDRAREDAIARGAFDPRQAFIPTPAQTPRVEPVSGDTPATAIPSLATGSDAPAIPLGDATRVPKVSGAPPATVIAKGPPRPAGLTLVDPSGAPLAESEGEGEGEGESEESSGESSVESGPGAASLFEAIDVASGAPPASSVPAPEPKAPTTGDNPWEALTGDVSYLDPTWKRNIEAMLSRWMEIHQRPKGKATTQPPPANGPWTNIYDTTNNPWARYNELKRRGPTPTLPVVPP